MMPEIGDVFVKGPIDVMFLGYDERPDIYYITCRWWYHGVMYSISFIPIHSSVLDGCRPSALNGIQYISHEAIKIGISDWEKIAQKSTWYTVGIDEVVEAATYAALKSGQLGDHPVLSMPASFPIPIKKEENKEDG